MQLEAIINTGDVIHDEISKKYNNITKLVILCCKILTSDLTL